MDRIKGKPAQRESAALRHLNGPGSAPYVGTRGGELVLIIATRHDREATHDRLYTCTAGMRPGAHTTDGPSLSRSTARHTSDGDTLGHTRERHCSG
jgi:hypothetical protein